MRLAAIVLFAASLTAQAAELKVERAYRDGRGAIVAEVSGQDPSGRLESGNTLFWGDERELLQLELTRDERDEAKSRSSGFEGGSIEVSESVSEISCGDSRPGAFARLADDDTRRLEARIRSGSTRLRLLPEERRALYLFSIPGTRDVVFVTEPRFNFHGDYRVFVGPPGRLREVPLAKVAGKEVPSGRFFFKSGGGLYVPMAIDLLNPIPRERRGSPTLIRSGSEPLIALQPARLSRADLARLGFGKRPTSRPPNPCGAGPKRAMIRS